MVCFNDSINFMYRPAIITDMLNPSTWALNNIRANFIYNDLQARAGMTLTPVFGGSFVRYPNTVFSMPKVPTTYEELAQRLGSYGSVFGMNPFVQQTTESSSSSSSSSSSGNEDSELKDKVNTLKTLLTSVQQYINDKDDETSKAIARAIADANKKKSASEAYDILKEAYNKIDAVTLKKTLTETVKLGDKKIAQILKEAGYEREDAELTRQVNDLYTKINSIEKNAAIAQDGDASILASFMAHVNTYEILDVISTWNNNHKDKSIINLAKDKINEDNKEEMIAYVVSPVATELTKKARTIVNDRNAEKYLDSAEIANIKELAELVDKNLTAVTADSTKENKNVGSIKSKLDTLNDKFNELYAKLRIASIKIADARINEKYDFLKDDKLNNVFMQDTLDDLKAEGLEKYTKNTSANNSGSTAAGSSSSNSSTGITTDNDEDKEVKTAKRLGKNVARWFKNWTTKKQKLSIKETVEDKVNNENAMSFLEGFYKERTNKKGIIRRINNKCRKKIELEQKVEFVEKIIESAIKHGISESCDEIQDLKDILADYGDDGYYVNRKKFKRSDRKAIDENIEKLYEQYKDAKKGINVEA